MNLSHRPQKSALRDDNAAGATEPFPGQGSLGSFLLFAGVAIAVLAFIDRVAGLPFKIPIRSWYANPMLWYFFALACFLSGIFLLRSAPAVVPARRWRPKLPGQRFERIIVYSRPECHLCDQAKDVLWAHRAWLPEIEEVDITGDPELMKQFSEQIPVVEIDGEIRFRGIVNEILLRRLINAHPPNPTA